MRVLQFCHYFLMFFLKPALILYYCYILLFKKKENLYFVRKFYIILEQYS